MINFEKIPNNLPTEIANTRGSGVVFCWTLSIIFDLHFDLLKFYNVIKFDPKKGINGHDITTYVNNENLYYYDFPPKSSVDIDFPKLTKANIATGLAFNAYGKDVGDHLSLITNMSGAEFSMLNGNPDYNDLRQVQGLYLFFITPLPDISEFIMVETAPKTKLNRYPNYGIDFASK